MSGRNNNRNRLFVPMRLADAADARFVELGRFIARLFSGRRPARRESGVVARTASAAREGGQPVADRAPQVTRLDWSAKLKLRELFHKDAKRRLAAARWFRRHDYEAALPALEGMLTIEDNEDVRREIVRVIRQSRPAGNARGGTRCSRSSAV
jgi:hypothetical protein